MIEDKFDYESLIQMGLDLQNYSDEEITECLEIFGKDEFYLFPKNVYGNRLLNDFMGKFRNEMFAG